MPDSDLEQKRQNEFKNSISVEAVRSRYLPDGGELVFAVLVPSHENSPHTAISDILNAINSEKRQWSRIYMFS